MNKKKSYNPDLDDQFLLKRYHDDGDMKSLGKLYDKYLHLVFGLCLKYLKSRDASKDAVMDIFEIIVVKLQNHEVTHFKSWLYMVSKNHCLMQLRKRNVATVSDEIFMELADDVHLNDKAPIDAQIDALEECIETLKNEQKQCVSAFYLQQKSYKEIAESSALEIGKVKSFIQNGKRNLRICIESKNV